MPWRDLFRAKRPLDSQLDAELLFHIDELIEEKLAAGLTPEQAKREAALEFGGRDRIKEELRDVHRIATLENTVANLKSAVRFIRKSPSFSITIILTLALGIGMNRAVFSALDAIILRPLPFPNSDELLLLNQNDRKAKNPATFVAPPFWRGREGHWRETSHRAGILPDCRNHARLVSLPGQGG
jgi:hypothetical protein